VADLEWSEADRARLADEVTELRRQLKSAQAELRSEERTQAVPIILPGGHRLVTSITRSQVRHPAWALSD
jgi:hypothetical protein